MLSKISQAQKDKHYQSDMVTYSYNPNYSGDRHLEDCGSMLAWAKSW
jgi:hypothetical protein